MSLMQFPNATQKSNGTTPGLSRTPPRILIIGLIAVGTGTAALPQTADAYAPSPAMQIQTSSGHLVAPLPHQTATDVNCLKRISGLTWDQLARMLSTSRRSVHAWASGTTMAAKNQEAVARALSTISTISRGSGTSTQAALMSPLGDGRLVLDLIADGQYDAAVEAATATAAQTVEFATPKASDLLAFLDAQQEPIHKSSGKIRSFKLTRAR